MSTIALYALVLVYALGFVRWIWRALFASSWDGCDPRPRARRILAALAPVWPAVLIVAIVVDWRLRRSGL